MKLKLLATFVLMMIALPARADELFSDCEDISSDSRNHVLFEYLEKNNVTANYCQRLAYAKARLSNSPIHVTTLLISSLNSSGEG
jgi:hypothetical protein